MSIHSGKTGAAARLAAIAITACIALCGCGSEPSDTDADGINAAFPEGRFEYGPIGWSDFEVIVDTHTGVTYLFYHGSNRAGLTPLLDRNGKPVIDDRYSTSEGD